MSELEWLEIRDYLLGDNQVTDDVERALQLASSCLHPLAQWLVHIVAGRKVTTQHQMRAIFAEHPQHPLAVCFAAILSYPFDLVALRRSADELGCAYAKARLVIHSEGDDAFRLAFESASAGEREGLYMLGNCYNTVEGSAEKAKESFLAAAKLNHYRSMVSAGYKFEETDPQRWHLWGRAALPS